MYRIGQKIMWQILKFGFAKLFRSFSKGEGVGG
jgi:hypothetical protein